VSAIADSQTAIGVEGELVEVEARSAVASTGDDHRRDVALLGPRVD
jgi:hypothetical protein